MIGDIIDVPLEVAILNIIERLRILVIVPEKLLRVSGIGGRSLSEQNDQEVNSVDVAQRKSCCANSKGFIYSQGLLVLVLRLLTLRTPTQLGSNHHVVVYAISTGIEAAELIPSQSSQYSMSE